MSSRLFAMYSIAYSISVDCPDLINFAYGLGMNIAQPSIWTALHGDCCTATRITCNGNQRVTDISWYILNLYGTINGTALPSGLLSLNLEVNNLSGGIPLNLPAGLLSLHLANNNRLTGSIPLLPKGLTELHIQNNQFSGDLPLFLSTITSLMVGNQGQGGNMFTGCLILNRPVNMYIFNNNIADVIVRDTSALTSCDLSNNPLLGNSHISGLTMCTQTNLYNASLSATKCSATASTTSTKYSNISLKSSLKITKTIQNLSEFQTTRGLASNDRNNSLVDTQNLSYNSKFSVFLQNRNHSSVLTDGVASTLSLYETVFDFPTTMMIGIVYLEPQFTEFTINWKMILRVIIDAILLLNVFGRTPFAREFKKLFKRAEDKSSDINLSHT